ncbi:hypothetical protein OG762_26395 [Streptomyces sp. NBC_01136]|uniref:hypothetical protein n=1 Tax=unclassified Streptomyces TaxID=2593676 RepID=UPI003244BCFB|nr:hypothetical protein OG762_26395 [Streptomyces sp. NBC_01136]
MAGETTHRWIVVLDIENFSPRPDPVQRRVRAAMYEVLDGAMERAGLMAADTVVEDRGDGVLMLISSSVSPLLIAGPLVRELDEELAQKANMLNEAHALRFRVALHQGLVTRDPRGWSGDAVNTACRLVDAQPLRDVLTAAPSARMVFAVSDQTYQGVIRHGHRGIDPAAYLPYGFTTKHGEAISSWITVPGYPAPPGLPTAAAGQQADDAGQQTGDAGQQTADTVPAGAAGQATGGRGTVTMNAGTVQGDQVGGDKHVTVHTTGTARP